MKSKILSLVVYSVFLFLQAQSQIGSRMTAFDPVKHGFKFANTFSVEVVNDIKLSGFCGGMIYTVMDYYKKGMPVPTQKYRPSNGTPLYNYIWGRQRTSVIDYLDKWAELFVNPFGWRTDEFFNWGLQGTGGGRLQELKAEIDKGNPIPIGLFKPGDGGTGPHHVVLAIGYKGGRYKGDLGEYKEDLEIYLYDPNYPDVVQTMKPKPAEHVFYYSTRPADPKCVWQTYFVHKKYVPDPPPVITYTTPAGGDMINELLFEFRTGGDDLRGGNDNVNVTFNFKTKPSQTINTVNRRARWIGNYTETVPVKLLTPVPLNEFKSVTVSTTFGGGIGGDNWNLDWLKVYTYTDYELLFKAGTPLFRFTGSAKSITYPLTFNPAADGKVRELLVEIETGGDDLRGGNDNVSLVIQYKDGSKQTVNNLNKSAGLGGGSFVYYTVPLSKPVLVTDLKNLYLQTSFGGGFGGDNWNLEYLRISARGGGVIHELFKNAGTPLKRFTGSDQTLTIVPKTD
jgi:hypothetical protein